MSDTNYILEKVQGAFRDAFNVNPKVVSIETSPGDIPEWDSVGHLLLASNLEQSLGISLDVDELMEMENVREIVRILSAKLSKKV